MNKTKFNLLMAAVNAILGFVTLMPVFAVASGLFLLTAYVTGRQVPKEFSDDRWN